MAFVLRNAALVALVLISGSEALIVQWARLAFAGQPLSLLGFAASWLLLAVANALLIALIRRGARGRGRAAFAATRMVLVGSLGAIVTGPMLLGVFGAIGLPLLAVEALSGTDALADTPLVAAGGFVVALGFGSIVWGCLVGRHRLRVERIDLPLRDLPPDLSGVRIAHITDLHIGPQFGARAIARTVERVNELDADLICITGDIFDFDAAYIEEGCEQLAQLRARHGVFAVLGNHDVYTGVDAVAAGLERLTDIHVLRDATTAVEIRGRALHLIGVEDKGTSLAGREIESAALPGLVDALPPGEPRVLLMHRPSYFPQVVKLGLPIALAGHTHGGQITLPGPAQHHNVSRLMTDWTRGLFERDGSLMYVSRGIGVAGPPVRLNCSPEIALLRLV